MTKRDEIFCWAATAAVTLLLALLAFAMLDWLPGLIKNLK